MKKSSVMNMNVANTNVAAIAPSIQGNKTMKTKAAKQAPILTAEELAMQTAKTVLQNARKLVTKEVNEFSRVCQLTVVTDQARLDQAEKVSIAQKAERIAQDSLDRLKGKIEDGEEAYNMFSLTSVDFHLSSTTLAKLIQHKEKTNEKEDRETIRQRGLVFGLVDLVNMNRGLNNILAVDAKYGLTGNDYELAARSGLRMRIQDNCTKAKFERIHHYVFGGKLGQMPVKPSSTLDFCAKGLEDANVSLPELKEALESKFHAYSSSEYEEAKKTKRVFISDKSITIYCGGMQATMNWKDFAKKSEYLNQIIFIAKSAEDSEGQSKYSMAKASLTAMERIAALHLSGVDLSGLKENKDALAVVVVALGKKGLDSARVVDVPFINGVTDLQLTPEMVAVNNILRRNAKHMIGPVLNSEQYGKHGYVQLHSTYLNKGTAFCDEFGNSFEDAAKLLVRLQKLAFNKATVQYNSTVHVIAGVDVKDVDASVNVSAQRDFNNTIARDLVGGNGIQSPELFKQLGTVRVVTGEFAEESGQKAMFGDAYYSSSNPITKIMKNIGLEKEFVIVGFNSTKSVQFKLGVDGWTQEFTTFKGKRVAYWIKSAEEVLKITDSATAEMWEINPENIVALQHVEGAIDTLDRTVNGAKSASIMELLYNQRTSITQDLYDRIVELREAGVIRLKAIRNKTNSQWNTGLEFQHGSDNAKAILEFIVAQNHAMNYRTNAVNSMFLMQGLVKDTDTYTLDAEDLIETIATQVVSTGKLGNLESQVWDMYAVETLVDALKEGDKPFVKLVFPSTGDFVTLPVTDEVLGSVENVSRANEVRVSGLLAELLYAFSYFIGNAKSVKNVETLMEEMDIDFSATAINIVIEKIATARDKACRGKVLSQIPTIGANCFLITSGLLHKNEMVSEKIMKAKKHAEYAYGQKVVGIYSKPPVLWMGSLSAILLLSFIKDDAEESRVAAFFDIRPDFHEIMMGNAAYQSPEKALANGNDADGDRVSVDFVPESLTFACEGLNPNNFVDPRKSSVSAGAHHYAQQWEKEMKGMVRNTSKVLGEYLVTSETFQNQMEEAVFAASTAKAAVAIYTTHQGVTLNNRGTFTDNVLIAMKRLAKVKQVKGLAGWMKDVLASEYASKTVSETIWKFTNDVQGACVNFDAMNQVKDSSGRDVMKLAEHLSATALKFMHIDFIQNDGNVLDELGLVRKMTDLLNTKTKLLNDTMFDKVAHNISFEQLIHILPKGYEEKEVQYFLSYVMAFAGMMTGVQVATTVDACQEAMRPVKSKVSNIETLLTEMQEDKNKSLVRVSCVARTMINSAMKFSNKKLVNKNN